MVFSIFLAIVIWNLKNWKRQKSKNSIFDSPFTANQAWITELESRTEFIICVSDLLILCISNTPNVWCLWSLKNLFVKILSIKRWFPFNFAKSLQGRTFMVAGPKHFKLLPAISFHSAFQKIVLSSLLLFSCAC